MIGWDENQDIGDGISFAQDILILLPERNRESVYEFLALFTGPLEPSWSEYQYPNFSEKPFFETNDLNTYLDFLIERKSFCSPMYWHFKGHYLDREANNVFVQFTKDKQLIGGITTKEKNIAELGKRMEDTYGRQAVVGMELCPPDTAVEIEQWIETGVIIY